MAEFFKQRNLGEVSGKKQRNLNEIFRKNKKRRSFFKKERSAGENDGFLMKFASSSVVSNSLNMGKEVGAIIFIQQSQP